MNATIKTSAEMLDQLITMICMPRCPEETKRRAIDLAYQIGKSEGHLEGAISMGDQLTRSLDRVTSKVGA